MSKENEIDLKVQQVIDALMKVGVTAVGLPQLVELHTTEDGHLDIPLRVRIAV